MLQADFVRFNQESIDFSKTLQEYKEDTISYIHALISQMSTSGSGPLLTKTPKPKKRNTRIKTIQENDENDFENSLSTTSSSSSSRADMILETSDLRPVRSKRGASVKAADIIKKQQAASLNAKLRRPGEGSDVPLANRVCSVCLFFLFVVLFELLVRWIIHFSLHYHTLLTLCATSGSFLTQPKSCFGIPARRKAGGN